MQIITQIRHRFTLRGSQKGRNGFGSHEVKKKTKDMGFVKPRVKKG